MMRCRLTHPDASLVLTGKMQPRMLSLRAVGRQPAAAAAGLSLAGEVTPWAGYSAGVTI